MAPRSSHGKPGKEGEEREEDREQGRGGPERNLQHCAFLPSPCPPPFYQKDSRFGSCIFKHQTVIKKMASWLICSEFVLFKLSKN